ncbi:MAG: hypothetical protein IJH59_06610, partial [Firmicutes bacterium]|nr:hypothetical protein [Bacillota bacterium]
MDENASRKYYIQLRDGLTDRGFLKRIGVTRKAMLSAFEAADLKKIAANVCAAIAGSRPVNGAFHIPATAEEQTPIDVLDLTAAVLPLLEELKRAGEIPDTPDKGDWLQYAYETMLARLFPVPEAQVYADSERPGAVILFEMLHVILRQERRERNMIPTFDLDMLKKSEARECVSGGEYLRFLRRSREYYIFELHVIASRITPFNTLSHVAGVHYVAMHMARQLAARQVLVDLAMVSAAAATHDIGKFGCRGDEVLRLPHLHYYYTDEFLQRMGMPGVAHIASNHSTWDLELENLSCENLLLIYADFRVKGSRDEEGREVARFYTMKEAFDVILNKLEKVDEAKRNRYQRVYEKLYDFEQYLISIGVSPDLEQVGDQPRCWTDAALLDAEAAKERLKYLAIEHNIHVMNRFGSDSDFGDLLEEAKSGRNWQNIHAYLNTLEEYFPYMTSVQKQMTIGFLRELLIHKGGDIRRQAAGLIGRIIAGYDERYRKELPPGIRVPEERIDSFKLWEEHLRVVIDTDLKRTERQQRWIGYSLKVTMAALLSHTDESNRGQYLELFLRKLAEEDHDDAAVFILADTALEIGLEYLRQYQISEILSFCRQAMKREEPEVRIAVLRILHRLATEGTPEQLTADHYRLIEELVAIPVAGDGIVSVAFLKYRTRQALRQKGIVTGETVDDPVAPEFSNADIFRDNLKAYTPWVIKAVNIEVMLDELKSGARSEVFYIATHLSNLLKVSERVTVRHKAGQGLLQIVDLMTREQRHEIVIELTKGLEIGEHQFSKYIPDYLGVLIMHLHPEELSEIMHELKHLLQSENDKVACVTLDTVAVMLQNYEGYRERFPEPRATYLRRWEKIIGMLLSGMANYHEAVSQEGFFALGKMIFGSEKISMAVKAEIFQVLHKKMLTLIEDRKGDTLRFFNNSASLNHIYRFISDYQFLYGKLPLREMKKAAFFPGTFDPFSLGHKGIVTTVRNMG